MISYSLISKVGGRTNNEDNVGMYQQDNQYYFALADGLGGHGKGEVASKIAVDMAIEALVGIENGANNLDKAFVKAQQGVMAFQQKDRTAKDMKTTLVVLKITEQTVEWGHIGDSRLYYFNSKKMVSRTLDHSVPQMLVSAGRLKEKNIRNHPDRNRLLRVMGMEWDEPKYQLGEVLEQEKNQAFLLCSDGFWELIDEKKMAACLKHASSPKQWLNLMEEIILKNGRKTEMDNYSAIGVWIE